MMGWQNTEAAQNISVRCTLQALFFVSLARP